MQPKQMQQHQMQQHEIQQKQMTQRQMTVRQMSNPQFTRQHNDHQHSMTIANPQRDTRTMAIPNNTFEEDGLFKMGSMPFRWLRTWLFSLLALIALPVGGMLVYVGTAMQEQATPWLEQTASVTRYDEDSVRFQLEGTGLTRTRSAFNFNPANFFAASADHMVMTLSLCDLVSRFIIPSEEDSTFTVWQNPNETGQFSCVPVSADIGGILVIAGWILVFLSAGRLLRTIQGAATKPAR